MNNIPVCPVCLNAASKCSCGRIKRSEQAPQTDEQRELQGQQDLIALIKSMAHNAAAGKDGTSFLMSLYDEKEKEAVIISFSAFKVNPDFYGTLEFSMNKKLMDSMPTQSKGKGN